MISWREDLAWCAGFFDGEGTVGFKHKPKPGYHGPPMLSLPNTDLDMIEEFKIIVKCGAIYSKNVIEGRLPCWAWNSNSFENSQAVMCMMWSFLSSDKKMKYHYLAKLYLLNKVHHPKGHGTLNWYTNKNCRCALCKEAARKARWEKKYG